MLSSNEEDGEERVSLIGVDDGVSGVNPQDDSIEDAAAPPGASASAQHQQQSDPLSLQPNSNHNAHNLLRSRKDVTPNSKAARRSGGSNTTNIPSPEKTSARASCLHRNNIQCMAAAVLWCTIISLVVAVVWYSFELFHHGTDPHLIAWLSAGAFVLLGFPVSMWGIIGHLTNYNAPNTQVYIVRILWMVPIYSIQSWLAMRFNTQALLFETLRDFYESYVLYSFLQFLIEVLGGEESLILMLKDKSPTRGVHMWGLQFCVKPWLMGQPVRRENVSWQSPFFVKCKFGVLQYVLLKLVCAVAVLVLEWKGLYKEGLFKWEAGYLYICILTNLSQCWALYCLIFFYYATKNELSPIRPVGKFLSVKALVFFTWWQSVFISVLVQMDMIPTYDTDDRSLSSDDVAKVIQDYLICVEMFIAAVVHSFVFPHSEYSVAAVRARTNALHHRPTLTKRLGRRKRPVDLELTALDEEEVTVRENADDEDAVMRGPSFFSAFMDSAIPRDLRDNTVHMMRGEFHVEKKTLFHHAEQADQYDLFSKRFHRKTDTL